MFAEFHYRLDIAFSFRSCLMDVSSNEIPDIVNFLCVAAKDRASTKTKG